MGIADSDPDLQAYDGHGKRLHVEILGRNKKPYINVTSHGRTVSEDIPPEVPPSKFIELAQNIKAAVKALRADQGDAISSVILEQANAITKRPGKPLLQRVQELRSMVMSLII